ncbi:glycosyltransferase family 2 protein [Maritalea mediterranea]|uniref:Glycosyltransferase n=1 Tax=Maritalea mediterranea TaxID=2909667 RepID=A0ABS9E2Z6_9HYPH|nr:glycosyltransferase family 2 protein [Maritalea mediterranea]MCF4097234.1 glycosyltransferase [Maritalea mediterranea]
MSTPLISIVMPAFKCSATLAEAVESVVHQTYDNWELVISIDDGEDYAALLASAGIKDQRIRFVSTGAVATGSSNARNVGVIAARSDHVAVLDADDLFVPDKLKIVAPLVADYPLISTGLQIVNADLTPLRQVGTEGGPRLLDAARYKRTNISMDSMIIYDRKRLPIAYDVDQPCLVDLDLILKAFCHTKQCFHLDQPLHIYRKQTVSISNGPQAASKFTLMKRTLIDRIESKYYDFKDGATARDGILAFLKASLATELQFSKQYDANPDLLFEDLLESNLNF